MEIERIKELMEDPNLSDKEAENIRDECQIFAEIIFDQWMYEKRRDRILKSKLKQADENQKSDQAAT